MTKSLKEFIIEYNQSEGWGDSTDDDNLYDTFEECFDVVEELDRDRHRWYTNIEVVREVTIDGVARYFQDMVMDVDGEDASREDCGWSCPDLDDIVEVYPKEVMTTIYVTKDKL